MKINVSKRNRHIARFLAMVMVLGLVFSMAITANAATENQAVTDAKKGVVQIQVWFSDPEAAMELFLHSGTGFLINENTVVTCQHVATGFPDDWYVLWAQATNEAFGGNRTATQVKENLELRVSVYRDVYVKATVKKASTEMDYAVLTLDETIYGRTPLKLRDSSQLSQTEDVYALGFPADIASLEDANHYDADDVTITTGNVNKVGDMSFITTDGGVYDSVNCVESSALITAGNSGGPLVDADGNVVGINAAGNDTRNIAISSKQLIDVLTALGITYTAAGSSVSVDTPESEENTEVVLDTSKLSSLLADAEEVDAEAYTEESYDALKSAVKAAKGAMNASTQAEIDAAAEELEAAIDALEENKGGSMGLIIVIVVVAVVLILIVVIVIVAVSAGKKKSKAQAAPAPVAPAAPARPVAPAAPARPVAPAAPARPAAPAAPVRPAAPASSETTVLNQGAGETTVLTQGAGETTVLSSNVNGGTLVRMSNNERIPICSANFTVGRERSSVDYCVGGNTNISRVHARFVVRNGATYIVDNKAANGTFVNGVKARAGQEIELKDGDKVLLADEKFEYKK